MRRAVVLALRRFLKLEKKQWFHTSKREDETRYQKVMASIRPCKASPIETVQTTVMLLK